MGRTGVALSLLGIVGLLGCSGTSGETTDTQTTTTQTTDTQTTSESGTAITDTSTGGSTSPEYIQAVTRHNEIRAEVYSDHALVWSDTVAASAQEHADYLATIGTLEHSSTSYGENLYASSLDATYLDAINSWYEEKSEFNFDTKTCYGEWYDCGHYTQLIWQDTTEVGCAKSSSASWHTIVVCQYNPPGNYIGETPY